MSSKRTGLHVGETLSPWIDTVEMPTFYQLNQNIEVEVCVVGGGLAGLTTAYLLAKEGKKVCVLEDFEIGSGQTGRTTAHITNVLDERFYKLEKMHTKNTVKLAIKSHTAAMQMIEEIVANESIDCDLEKVDAYLYTEIGQPTEEIDKELTAAQELGFTDVQKVGFAPFKSHITGPALCFKNQLQFHPLKYMRGLVESIERLGGKFYSKTHVLDVSGGGDGAEVKTKNGYKVKCESVVVATNSPVNDRVAIHTKQASYRSYVIALDAPKGSVEKALYWDTLAFCRNCDA